MTEQLIYEDGKIRITTNVFYNGQGGQFVIPTIRGIRDLHKGKNIWTLIFGLVLIAAASIPPFVQYQREGLGGLGVLLVLWYMTSKEKYTILLTTPAGEVEAFVTKNEQQFKNVMNCLKRAVALHQ
ncbi:MAG TPA: DUF6232 family protein [Alphaproteobacteria bacterium]